MDTLGSVTLLTGFEERPDHWKQLHIPGLTISLPLLSGRLGRVKTVKPASGYAQKPTECGNRMFRFMGSDESSLVHLGFTALAAKKADALCKISTSSVRRLFSLRRRASSAASAFWHRLASAEPNASISSRYVFNCEPVMPSSLATLPCVAPGS
jgi:hypothetical protein